MSYLGYGSGLGGSAWGLGGSYGAARAYSPPKPPSPGQLLRQDPLFRLLEAEEQEEGEWDAAFPPDALLVVGGEAIPIRKQILAMHSPVLARLLSGPPDKQAAAEAEVEDDALKGLPAFRLSSPEHEAVDAAAHKRSAWGVPGSGLPPLTPATAMAFASFCYQGALPGEVEQLPMGRLLGLGALLHAPRFMAALDSAQQEALFQEGIDKNDLDAIAELAVKYRLPRTASALVALLSVNEHYSEPGKEKGREVEWTGPWTEPWQKLDDACKQLAFAVSWMPPAQRATAGAGPWRGMAAEMQERLQELGWAEAAEWRKAPAPPAPAAGKGTKQGSQQGSGSAAGAEGMEGGEAPETAGETASTGGAPAEAAATSEGAPFSRHLTAEGLAGTPYKELQQMARERGLKASGKAQELIDRILEHQEQETDSD